MTNRPGSFDLLHRLSGSVGRCVLVLTAVTALAFAAIGPLAYSRSGTDGLLAASAAVAVCWTGSVLALLISAVEIQDPNSAISRLMMSIVFRTAVPFGGAVLLSASSTRLADAGVFGLTVAFYLITLATETVLSLGLLNGSTAMRRGES